MKPPRDAPAPDWRHLGNCLTAARNGRSVPEIAAAAGVSVMSIYAYESGRAYAKPPAKMWRLVNYYRWTPDSLDAVLAGGLPRVLPAATHEQAAVMMARVRADASLSHAAQDALCKVIQDMVTPDDPSLNGTNRTTSTTAPTP